ncbi:MAG TPA: alpha-L-arabinofuranosidase C-terminal domain-containing protein, partial [Chthonomonadales bacterium]|nr:alpha-L-arabinofuranosidase C-terminal domain-containing protein [Chthonomonadales bacterium]
WPGGCFADDYHWRDGVGPAERRPRRVNMHWGNVIETNQFGTHEFIRLCRAAGAQPYLCGNVGSGTPQELRDWVEYCNFPGGSSLSDERRANGAEAPFGVRYWGVGNENWGCGGSFTPEDYGTEYRRFAGYLRDWGGTALFRIACGPNGNDLEWTRRFFRKLKSDYGDGPCVHGFSAHYYTWNAHGKYGSATEYNKEQWYGLLGQSLRMEDLVVQQRLAMDEVDPYGKIGLIVDEWGTWHPSTSGKNPKFLWQQNTVRDGLVAALTLDIFNRHADKVVMGNIAQTINVLQALLLTEEHKLIKTPTYHVYDLYSPHQGGRAVRLESSSPHISYLDDGAAAEIASVAGSASIKNDLCTVTLVNVHAEEPMELVIKPIGASVAEAGPVIGLTYPSGELQSHNTAENLQCVAPGSLASADTSHSKQVKLTLRPASVTRLQLKMAR